MKFVVYEVWTKGHVVEAESMEDALRGYDPVPIEGLSLCNWHAVPVTDDPVVPAPPRDGVLGYLHSLLTH